MLHFLRHIILTPLTAIIFFLLVTKLNGQSSLSYGWYFNVNGGITQCYGDVQNENNLFMKLDNETSYGFGMKAGKYLGSVFSVNLQFLYGNLKGQNDAADLVFSNDMMEYQLGTNINLLNLFFGKKERRINLYGTTGVGVMFFRSEASRLSNGEIISNYGYNDDAERSKSNREFALAIPVGAGLDIKLSNKWYLNLESAIRFTNSDKLDATINGPKNDTYYYTSLGLSYNFSEKAVKENFETSTAVIPEDPMIKEKVDLVYHFPDTIRSMEEFTMTCVIHKGKITGPGKLTQILPIGLEILDTIIAGARTEIKSYTLFLHWDELPSDSVFEVRYRAKPDKIFGTLPMVSNLFLERTGKEYKFRTSVTIERASETIAVEQPLIEPLKEDQDPAHKDIEFRVQIRAGYKSKIPIETLSKKFNLSVEFKEDCIGNWCHYSVGSFDTYEQAREYRNTLISGNGIKDAFVVAFYKGKRLNELSELKEVAPEAYPIKTVYKESGYCYRVQIMALINKSIDPELLKDMYKIEEEVNEEVYHNWRKYTVGKCTSISEAKLLLIKLKDKGISDAFIAIYKNGERVLMK